MNPVKPRFAQSGLFIPAAPEPVKLELTLARIKAIVGEDRVGSPELMDTHRPDAFRMGQAARLRRVDRLTIGPQVSNLPHRLPAKLGPPAIAS
jgi:hypothetical protein